MKKENNDDHCEPSLHLDKLENKRQIKWYKNLILFSFKEFFKKNISSFLQLFILLTKMQVKYFFSIRI